MRLKFIVYFLLGGCLFVSCTAKLNTEFHDTFITITNDDTILIKSGILDDAWKPTYQYAVLLPKNLTGIAGIQTSSKLSTHKTKYTPENTIILGDISESLCSLFPSGYTIRNIAWFNVNDNFSYSPVVLAKIEKISPKPSDKDCNFKLTKIDTLLWSRPEQAKANSSNIYFSCSRLQNEAIVNSSRMNEAWSDSYQYAIEFPQNAPPSTYSKLKKILTQNKYSSENTIICCENEQADIIRKYIPNFPTVVLEGTLFNKPEITVCSVKHSWNGKEHIYTFRIQ